MKNHLRHFLLTCALALPATFASAQTPNATEKAAPLEYPMVEKGHWAYDAVALLEKAEWNGAPIVKMWPQSDGVRTRFEFAVTVALSLEKLPRGFNVTDPAAFTDPTTFDFLNKNSITSDSPLIGVAEVKDALASLQLEFAFELRRLGQREFGEENGLMENRVQRPTQLKIDPSILLRRTGTASIITTPPAPKPK